MTLEIEYLSQQYLNKIIFQLYKANEYKSEKTNYHKKKSMLNQEKIQGYIILRKLGEGSFGEVLLGKNNSDKYVAIKKISKEKIIKVNKLHEPFIQKQILLKLNQSSTNFFIRIQSTHSDEQYVYMFLQFCQGGTLDDFIKKSQSSSIQTLRKIMARLVLIMQSLHSFKLIHRDLKPSNILLTKEGYLKLSDFGTGFAPDNFFQPDIQKQIKAIKNMAETKKDEKIRKLSEDEVSTNSSQRRYTFVGTACYMAPELLNQDKCGPQADLWALGCIFYQMLHKRSPFYDQSEGMVWTKILNSEINVYQASSQGKQISEQEKKLQNLINQLLVKQHQKRLGYGADGYSLIKSHEFFAGINWNQISETPINQITAFVTSQMKQAQLQLQKKQTEKDRVLFSGVVGKKMYFGNYKQRTLVLHSFPKLVYYDTDSGEKKGEIILTKSTPLKSDPKYFEVSNEKKTYYFKSKQSNQWVEMIKLAILNAFY